MNDGTIRRDRGYKKERKFKDKDIISFWNLLGHPSGGLVCITWGLGLKIGSPRGRDCRSCGFFDHYFSLDDCT